MKHSKWSTHPIQIYVEVTLYLQSTSILPRVGRWKTNYFPPDVDDVLGLCAFGGWCVKSICFSSSPKLRKAWKWRKMKSPRRQLRSRRVCCPCWPMKSKPLGPDRRSLEGHPVSSSALSPQPFGIPDGMLREIWGDEETGSREWSQAEGPL